MGGRGPQIALVVGSTAIVGSTLHMGTLAPFILGVLLVAANVVALRWSVGRRRRPADSLQRLGAALAFTWLAVAILPSHNFANRPNEAAVSSVGAEALIELLVYLAAGVMAVVAIRAVEPDLARSRPPMPLFLLPVWVIASATWSQTGPYAFARGLQMLAVPFLAWATIALARADRPTGDLIVETFLRWFVRLTVVLAVLGAAFGPVYVPTSGRNLDRYTWVGMHPNGAGLILSVAIVIILATPARVLRLPPLIQVAAAAGLLAAMYANHSRAAWLCLVVGLAVVFVLRVQLTPMLHWVGTPLLAAGVVTALYFWGDRIWDYVLRDSGSDDLATGNGRLQLWGIGFRALETPFDWVGGLGFGAARVIFVAELDWARTAHNSVLSLLVSVGLIGVALLAVTVVQATANVVRARVWLASPSGVAVTSLLALVLVNGLATDILAEPNIGFTVLNLVAAAAFVHRLAPARSEPPEPPVERAVVPARSTRHRST